MQIRKIRISKCLRGLDLEYKGDNSAKKCLCLPHST